MPDGSKANELIVANPWETNSSCGPILQLHCGEKICNCLARFRTRALQPAHISGRILLGSLALNPRRRSIIFP